MLIAALQKLGRALRRWEDPRYRNAPFILPKAWHGSGPPVTAESLKGMNVRDIGLDPAVVAQQPHNRMLRMMSEYRQL